MQKEIIIVLIIIVVIIAAHVLTQNYTKSSVKEMDIKLSEIDEYARKLEKKEETNKDELMNKIENMQQDWRTINRNLAFYIEHDELEKVNTSLTLMKGYLDMEDYSQGVPELENCIYILYHIQDKQSLKIINLF